MLFQSGGNGDRCPGGFALSGGNFECPVDFNPGDFFSLEMGNRDLFLCDGSGDGEAEHEEDECNFFHDYYFLMGRLKVVKSYKG